LQLDVACVMVEFDGFFGVEELVVEIWRQLYFVVSDLGLGWVDGDEEE